MANNISTITGVIYSKEEKTWPNKKAGEPDYRFCNVRIEFEVNNFGRKKTCLSDFVFDYNVSFDEYSVGDSVEIDFYPCGKEIKYKEKAGSWWKDEKKIAHCKFADLYRTQPKAPKDNKITVSSMSNIDTIGDPPVKDETFVGARPAQVQDNEWDDDNLPF